MFFRIALLLTLTVCLLIVYRMRGTLRAKQRIMVSALATLLFGGGLFALEWFDGPDPAPGPPQADGCHALSVPLPSQTCVECHKTRHANWHHSYHRTMTREATPENVKADFNDAVYEFMGVSSRMYRRGDRYFVETADPEWLARMDRQGVPPDRRGPIPRRVFSVDRLVGSHWFQQILHRDEEGRYLRIPLIYHLVEKRWIHVSGAFLAPELPKFLWDVVIWNESCLFCHNTGPNKNPESLFGGGRGYNTEVSELGISCEACHGPGERHIQAQKNPDQGGRLLDPNGADPTIANPARLTVKRCDDVCARCHGAAVAQRHEGWDPDICADPFRPGQEIRKTRFLVWSEAEFRTEGPRRPNEIDGRFWGDGTPLTTALEYQGMALSKCYQGGEGKMSCLSCHDMHGSDPNHQLKEGMRTNEACYGCHDTYRKKLVEHTHHAADSTGSLCQNCHMPHQVYSLLTTHRSHRIAVPRVRDSIDTGKPHACNLCHLDKSLGWTGDQLQKWYGTKPEPLSDDDRTIASSLLHLTRSDARSRAVVAGAFSWPPAQQASGRDWPGLLLTRILEEERYPAVRYLAHRALKSLPGGAGDYNYLAQPSRRAAQIRELQMSLRDAPRPDRKRYPALPLTAEGLYSEDVLDRLLRGRKDPDLGVHE